VTQASLPNSTLATRLVVAASVLSAVILLAAGIVLSTIYRAATEQAFDERLHIYLKSLAADLAAPLDPDREAIGSLGEPRFDLPLSGWYWQVRALDNAGERVRASRSLVGMELVSLADMGLPAGPGERREGYMRGPDERRLRVVERLIDLVEDGRFRVTVAGDADEIEKGIADFQLSLVLTFTALGLMLAGVALLQVRFGLKPLKDFGAEVAGIRRGLASRVAGDYPPDIAPLAQELNLLLDMNHQIVERSRTQVGNLAHALKTPLSVIVNEAESQAGPLSDKIVEQAGLMRGQISYHLDRARAAAAHNALASACDLGPVVDSMVRMFTKLAAGRALAIDARAEPDLRLRVERQDIEEMLGNLIDNACKWARERVEITARTDLSAGRTYVLIDVDDDGPGLSPDLREEALRRGRRLDESKPGSGLGLAIVVDLARLYAGSLTLETSPAGGLRASLRLPGA
jgi:signal transduction histidine kinase